MYNIDYNSFRSVKGFNRRVRFLVMHYTAFNFKDSIDALTGPSVALITWSPIRRNKLILMPVSRICVFLILLMKMSVPGMQE